MSKEYGNPDHLGDGAYVTMDEYGGIWLTANHHDLLECSDKVYLDPHAVEAFGRFVERMKVQRLQAIAEEIDESDIA